MRHRKIIIVISVIMVLILSIYVLIKISNHNEMLELEQSKAINMNYNKDISSMYFTGLIGYEETIRIRNQDQINKTIDMLNSLELVEMKKNLDFKYPEGQYVYLHMGSRVFVLFDRYIIAYYEDMPETMYTMYYVQNPKLPFQDENNEFTNYIKSLAEEN